ncbi:N(G),N(G)-dimethylarginine dimethylaminohydrolase 1 [Manduca sexta]|uniref:Dimethylargininase n=1 Tax=Manduca sexta TaxID=7130 RepID=A0A921YWX8_MANSE|nr:N(G),N(G)-dimethylarginine dimethylaminohydrolase 1 [Manduca sexta]KAG6446530.1 hypothetical protein O3G_MSEX004504 [Manduca sexta]
MEFKMHEYTHVLVGKISADFKHNVEDNVDFDDARRQHDCYLRLLRELNVDVIELDFEGSMRENLFLEDMAVICHGIALLPKPKSDISAQNMKLLKKVLKEDLGQTIIDQLDPEASICCSDVLFTGREFFVGISDTTNEAGASAVAEAYPEFPCTPIKVSKGAGNLKKYITVAGPDILCVGASKEAKELLKRMEREANFSYQTLTVPEDEASNCLYINGTLIHRAIEEIPEAFKVFCEKIDFARRSICFSELAKLQMGLSTCCLLVRKP